MTIRRTDGPNAFNLPRTDPTAGTDPKADGATTTSTDGPAADQQAKPLDVNSRNAARAAARANEARVANQLAGSPEEAITGNPDLDAVLKQLPPETLAQLRNLAKSMRQMAPAQAQSRAPSTPSTNPGRRSDVKLPDATAGPTSAIDAAFPASGAASGNIDLDALVDKVQDEQNKRNFTAPKPKPAATKTGTATGQTTGDGSTPATTPPITAQSRPAPPAPPSTDPPVSGAPTAPPSVTPGTDPPVSGAPGGTPQPAPGSDPPVSGTPGTPPVTTPPVTTPPVTTPPVTTPPVTTPPVTTPPVTTPPVTTPPVTVPPVTTPPVATPPVTTPPVTTPPVTTPPVTTPPVTAPPVTTPPVVAPPVVAPPPVAAPPARPSAPARPPVQAQSRPTTTAPAVPPPVMDRRYETTGSFAPADQDAARTALGNRMFAQLQTAGLLPDGTKLDSPLPADIQKRVDADPELAAQKPQTYGQLMKALVGDGDKDGKLDYDAFQLNKVVPNATQQQLLNAVSKDIPDADLQSTLKAAGADDAAAKAASDPKLVVDPPKAFGLDGKNKIDEIQQQTLLRTGILFADANNNGKLDPSDKVSFLDGDGNIKDTTFAQLPDDLQKTVKLNVATSDAARAYAALPSKDQVNFPAYNRASGDSQKEAVNKSFWTVGTANVRGDDQVSWSLNAGKTPAAAIDDVVGGKNSNKYTTECAQMRDVMRLKGLKDYYTNEYGKDEGTFRFNAQFPKDDAAAQKANDYLSKLDDFKRNNPGKGWNDFQSTHSAPHIDYAMQISRHDVLSGTGSVIAPWQTKEGESAAGDAGYFHNHSVSVEGVRIGYVGENVLDVGFKKNPTTGKPERQFWGHPGGVQTETEWKKELASSSIEVRDGQDIQQYFSRSDVVRGIHKAADEQTKRIDALLKKNPPADQKLRLQQDKGIVASSQATLGAVSTNVDAAKTDGMKAALANPTVDTPADMAPIYDALNQDGKERATLAFAKLHPSTQDALAKVMGKSDKSQLTDAEKAKAAMYATMTDGSQLTRTAQNTLAQSIVNANADSYLHGPTVDDDGASGVETAPARPMYSRNDFAKWVKSGDFANWYQQKTGTQWTGAKSLDDMSQDDVRGIVELAMPQTASMRTVYDEVNGGTPQTVSSQLAALLKNGKLPDAEYRAEGTSVPQS